MINVAGRDLLRSSGRNPYDTAPFHEVGWSSLPLEGKVPKGRMRCKVEVITYE